MNPRNTHLLSRAIVLIGILLLMIAYGKAQINRHKSPEYSAQAPISSPQFTPSQAQGGLARMINRLYPPKNAIEQARNATVFIRTAWGTSGTGFIINAQCDVVTNKHIIEEKNISYSGSSSSGSLSNSKRLKQKAIDDRIDDLRAQYNRIRRQRGTGNYSAERIQQQIASLRAKRSSYNDYDDYDESTSSKQKDVQYQVTLVDGTVVDEGVSRKTASKVYDVAVLSLPVKGCPYINLPRSATASVAIGAKLFAVGNPKKLTSSINEGVYVGMEQYAGAGVHYIKSSIKLNPSIGGSPLITESGNLVGINTSKVKARDGSAYSIPVEYLFFDML